MTKTILRRHHADESALLDATVHAAPVVRPRGVAPAPLRGRPGIAADVLRELRAADAPPAPVEQIRHTLTMATAPLAAMLAAPLPPVTNWLYYLKNLEAREIDSCLAWRQASIRQLDAVYNDDMRWWYAATAEVIHPARELAEQLVNDMAASILAEVTAR